MKVIAKLFVRPPKAEDEAIYIKLPVFKLSTGSHSEREEEPVPVTPDIPVS